MRKFSFFLLSLLCLYGGNVWGANWTWTPETISSGTYYICNWLYPENDTTFLYVTTETLYNGNNGRHLAVTSSPVAPANSATAFTLTGTSSTMQCTIGGTTYSIKRDGGTLSLATNNAATFTFSYQGENNNNAYNIQIDPWNEDRRYINKESTSSSSTVNFPKSATSADHSEWWYMISADQVAVYNGRVCNFSATANKNVATDSEGTASASVSVASYALANYADRSVTHSVATFTAVDRKSDPTKSKLFIGWSETVDGDIVSTENPYSVNLSYGTQSKTLYAIFVEKKEASFTWNAASELNAFSQVADVFSSTSDAPYTITSSDETIAKVINNVLYTYKTGSVTLTVSQTTNDDWYAKVVEYPLSVTNVWTCKQGNGPNPYGEATETYISSGKFSVDTIMYQTIKGLEKGYYIVEFYAIVNSANGVTSETGAGYAHVFANDGRMPINLIAQNSCTPTDYPRSLFTYVGDNGILKYGVYCDVAGGNWCVVKAKSIRKFSTIGEITNYVIVNPGIYQASSNKTDEPEGWKVYADGTVVGNNQKTTDASCNTQLEYYCDRKNKKYKFDYYQSIYLSKGTYRLSADMFFRGPANTCGLYAYPYCDYSRATVRVSENSSSLKEYSVEFTITSACQVNIGIMSFEDDPAGDWFAADNFKLYLIESAPKSKTLVNGYGMLYNSEYDILIDDENTQAYAATVSGETITLHELFTGGADKIIPADNVVLLHNSLGTPPETIPYHYVSTGTPVTVTDGNCFIHHNGLSSERVNYVLAKRDNDVAFYLYTGEESDLDGYNVLQLPAPELGEQAPSMLNIVMDENNTTALIPVVEGNGQTSVKANNMQIYTIMGIPVSDMSRPGIYIQNGKKYIVY